MKKYAAHIRCRNSIEEEQSVKEHCEQVAERSAEYAKAFSAENIARLQGLLHDSGKLNNQFNEYIHGRTDLSRGSIDHCYAGAKFLMEFAKNTKSGKVAQLAELTGRTIISHHGLHDWITEDAEDYFLKRISKTEQYTEISENIREMISDEELVSLIKMALEDYRKLTNEIISLSKSDSIKDGTVLEESRTKVAFYFGLLERLLESVLVDADRTDAANFEWDTEIEVKYLSDIWEEACKKIEKKSQTFLLNKDPVSAIRCDISERCRRFAEHEVGICRLTVPTGGGKTLSSLRFAVHYCKRYKKDRIFYIAPFMSILEQNSSVWKEIVGKENCLEHHSDILSGIADGKELMEYELRTEKWDLPVIATTLVQFLNTFFSGKMSSVRRMHRLCNSVIIIDEVQPIPVKCVNLFNLAMNFISEICNSCVVLCSATQPGFENIRYHLNLDAKEPNMTGDFKTDFEKMRRNKIVPVWKQGGYSFVEAASFCNLKSKEKGSVLFVVNTKKSALEIYNNLKKLEEDSFLIIHLSTNLCPNRRKEIIEEIRENLNKGKRMICVTTQLIEAGVDISFPCVIRALDGLDHIAQAAGRCNRNGEWEECCEVYLINLNEEKINRLPDIKMAQDVAKQVLRSQKYSDLMSVEAISAYFKKYYKDREKELSYKVQDISIKTNLLDLLSLNQNRKKTIVDNRSENYFHRQAFRTAGELFHVISNDTVAVIVPDNDEAVELIAALHSEKYSSEFVKILRKAQKYIVEIYSDMEKKLLDIHAIEKLPSGVYVLQKEYYDRDTGIILEGKPMDLLIF